MAGRGRGRGGDRGRLNPEQFGLPKEEDPHIDVTPPLLFPPRAPMLKPLPLTESVLNMLEVGQSIKETILHRMETGNFHEKLVLPQELITASQKKRKRKKKTKKVNLKVLDDLEAKEENAEDASDVEQGVEGESSESAEERDSDDTAGSEDGDEEMDEGNDYCHDYYNEEDELGPDEDEDYNEAMA